MKTVMNISYFFLLSQLSIKLTKDIFCHSTGISSSYRKHCSDQHSMQTRISDFYHLRKTRPRNNICVGKLILETQEMSILRIPSNPQFFPHPIFFQLQQEKFFVFQTAFFFNSRLFCFFALFSLTTHFLFSGNIAYRCFSKGQ